MSLPGTIRPTAEEYVPFYAGYVAKVPDGDVVAQLREQIDATTELFAAAGETSADHRYAAGKWTVRQVAIHLTDAERVLSGRALRFARGDETPLPGFEEDDYARAVAHSRRPLAQVVAELVAVRHSTVALFEGLETDDWKRAGEANEARVTVRALAYIIAGHELHHREILVSRYGLATV